ncbi:MAG: antitoxin family protein [Gemmataceae bacterium]
MATTIHAVYENGVFRPKGPVALPEAAEVAFEPRLVSPLADAPFPRFISDPDPSPDETRRLLDQMASRSTGQALPADWSRADLDDDHD